MLKNILSNMDGVSIYPIISLLIFFVFFLAVGIYVYRIPKKETDQMKNLPLED